MKTYDLEMVRGDTLSFDVVLSEEVDTSTVSSLFFSAKALATQKDYDFQKGINNGIEYLGENTWRVRVAPEDTANLPAKKYKYDLQLGINNDIITIMMGTLTILQDITVMNYGE